MRTLSSLLVLSLSVVIFSCNQKRAGRQERSYTDTVPDTLTKGIVPQADQSAPAVTATDTKPKPATIALRATNSKSEIIPLINFEHYNIDEFLHVSSVKCSYEDSKGNMWFGTIGGGVIKYDGNEVTHYTKDQGLPHTSVLCITEDKNGNLWFGTGEGLSMYNGKSFTNYSTADGLTDNSILSLHEDNNNNLWLGTTKGLAKYDGKKFTTYTTEQGLVGDRIITIAETRSGNLWLGTSSGASMYNGKTFENFSTDNGLASNLVYSIVEDKNGSVWLGTLGGGVSVYKNKAFTNYTTAQGLADDHINCIKQDTTGRIWLATNGGISVYDGTTFTNYTTDQGLGNNEVKFITEDKDGNLWFTTKTDISVYDFKQIVFFNNKNPKDNEKIRVKCITEDKDGNLWLGTDGDGLSKYDGKNFTSYSTHEGLGDTLVSSILQDRNGAIWFTTNYAGVYRFDGKTFTNYTAAQGLGHEVDVFQCIREDKAGNIWFGSNGGGATKYDGKSFTNYTTDQGLANNNVKCITEDSDGRLWFGTEGGISIYDGKGFTNYTIANGLPGNEVYSIAESKKGTLFIGTKKGLARMVTDGSSVAAVKFHNYTTANGLPDNTVTQVTKLSDGNIMLGFGTKVGIAVLNPEMPLDANNKLSLTLLNSNTDYPVKGINDNPGQGCIYQDSKGVVWAGLGSVDSRGGLLSFDYKSYNNNKKYYQPKVVAIENIKINWQDICWYLLNVQPAKDKSDSLVLAQQQMAIYNRILSPAEKDSISNTFSGITFESITPFYPLPQKLQLPYSSNNVTIAFNCITPTRHNLVNYRYKLQGYDTGWSPSLRKQEATFGNINEGTYTFMVKAQSPDGVWSEPATYTFTVLPPWYRTRLAYLLYIIGTVSVLAIVYRWRIASLKKRQKELEQTVKERTAEIVQKNLVVEEQKKELEIEKIETDKQYKRSEELLLNILPTEVAQELKQKGYADAKYFNEVTVLFTDFVNFTTAGERMTAKELVDELHACFKAFDTICGKYNIEKIKTVGDAYLAVAGLPMPDTNHASNIINAALEIRAFMHQRKQALGDATFGIRIGVNSGAVVAGIVGIKKFAYDIWGDTVNTAARMEQNSEAFKINISESTYQLVKDNFNCIHRGKIAAKNKGSVDMYFVEPLEVSSEP